MFKAYLKNEIVRWVFIILGVFIFGWLLSVTTSLYHQTVLVLAGINVILVVSLNLINGFTGQFSLGHAGFMAVGAYSSATWSTLLIPALGWSNLWGGLNLFIGLIVGGVFAGAVGFLVGLPSLRLRGDYLAIVTLGFGEIIRVIILNIESIGGARGLIGIPQLCNLYWVIAVSTLCCFFTYRILQSVPGKQFMAVRDDEVATTSIGLSPTRIKVRAFVLGSFFAGVAGALFAHFYAYLNPSTFMFTYSFQILTMVVLGGMGSLTGSVVAAVGLTVLLEALRDVQNWIGFDIRMVLYALILIIVMLTRPQGIFGQKEFWQFLPKRDHEST